MPRRARCGAEVAQHLLGAGGLGLALVGAGAGDDGQVGVHHDGVLDEDRVRAVGRRRHLDRLPALGLQGRDVGLPLALGEVEVDRDAVDVGSEQAVGERGPGRRTRARLFTPPIPPSPRRGQSGAALRARRSATTARRRGPRPCRRGSSAPRRARPPESSGRGRPATTPRPSRREYIAVRGTLIGDSASSRSASLQPSRSGAVSKERAAEVKVGPPTTGVRR